MRRTLILIGIMAMLTAACGDDDATTSTAPPASSSSTAAPATTQAPATTVAVTTTTTEAPAALPESSIISVVDGDYKFGPGPEATDDLPFDLGSIDVHWFTAGDRMVAVYIGLDLDATGPLCPGNSIFTGPGWEHISNAPSPGADCTGAPTIIDSVPGVSGVQTCNGLVSYITDIPSNLDGDLYGSVEIYDPAGSHMGASGFVTAAAVDLPDIDPASLSC